MLRVGDGQGEDTAEAGMAHSVLASEEGGTGGGIGGEAGEAFDLFFWWWGTGFWEAEDGTEEAGWSLG